MATRISDIVEKQAYDQVEKLQTDLNQLLDTFNKVANGATLLNKAIMDGTNYTAKAQNTTKTTQALSEMEKMQKKIIETQNKLNAAQTLHGQILAEERVKLLEANQANKDFVKAKQAQAGSIEELRLKLKAAQQEYDRMAASERQAARGTEILNHIKKVDAELKSLEGATGRFQRNVGNYASAFNPLSNSIQQLTREMPAFTNSVQTGFMAISNNLPALFDAIQNIRQQNTLAKDEAIAAATAQGLLAKEQALVGGASEEAADKIKEQATAMALSSAEGVKGKGILKQLATSFFSLSTAISIGITLLTVYGKDIIEWVSNLIKAAGAVENLSAGQKLLNEALLEGSKNATAELVSLSELYKVTQDTTVSVTERKKAVDELQKTYPAYFANIKDETFLNGGAKTSYDELKDSILSTARAKAIENKMAETINKDLEEETKLRQKVIDAEKKAREDKGKQIKRTSLGIFDVDFGAGSFSKEESDKRRELDLKYARLALADFKQEQQDKLDVLSNAIDQENKIVKRSEEAKKSEKEKKKSDDKSDAEKELREKEKRAEKEMQLLSDIMDWADDEVIEYLKGLKEKSEADEAANKKRLDDAKATAERIKNNNIQAAKEQLDFMIYTMNANQALLDKEDKLSQENLQKQLDRLDKFRQAVQLAEQILNNIGGLIADQANARAERELKELDRTTTAQLAALDKVAMSVAQKEEEKKRIEIQSEARRKQIERDKITDLRKAAKLQKAADIASIISGTAVAIINALKTQPTYLGIALAAGIGANGAIQLARAYAAPLPQYAKGRNGGKEEFAEVNENGVELIESKDGKLSIANGGKRGVTFLKQGDKVHTNEDFMKMVESRTTLVPQYTSTSSDMFQQKQLQAVYDLQKEVKGLNSTMMRKKDGWKIEGTFAHDIRVESIRM